MSVGSVEFHEAINAVIKAEWTQQQSTNACNAAITHLRTICPHLVIAASEIGGKHTRMCQHCGIQEIEWYSNFKTLTIPGGTWYDGQFDKSKERRAGQVPVLFPMSPTEFFSYRRGPHVDVTEMD